MYCYWQLKDQSKEFWLSDGADVCRVSVIALIEGWFAGEQHTDVRVISFLCRTDPTAFWIWGVDQLSLLTKAGKKNR